VSENLCITDCFIKYVHKFKPAQNRECIYFERVCQELSDLNPVKGFGSGSFFIFRTKNNRALRPCKNSG